MATRTRKGYEGQIRRYKEWCSLVNKNWKKEPKDEDIASFMGWLYYEYALSGDQISACLTGLNHHFRCHWIKWKRSEAINYRVKCYRGFAPSKVHPKKPFCYFFVWWFFKSYYDPKSFRYFACLIALSIGYWLGARPGEYSKYKGSVLLKYRQLEYTPDARNPKEMSIRLTTSKTNQDGRIVERLCVRCQCGKKRFKLEAFCPVHAMVRYQYERKKLFGRIKGDDPLIVSDKNRPFSYTHILNFLHYGICRLSKIRKVKLEPSEYTPHSLRVGATTDRGREGWDSLRIEKFGRWRTLEWRQVYVKLDFIDLAKLRKETVGEILDQFNFGGRRQSEMSS